MNTHFYLWLTAAIIGSLILVNVVPGKYLMIAIIVIILGALAGMPDGSLDKIKSILTGGKG